MAVNTIDAIPASDIFLITTPDDKIASICQTLLDSKKIKAGNLVIHTSGVLASNVLLPAQKVGACIGSFHPIYSFANPELAQYQLPGHYCVIEGDKLALPIINQLIAPLKMKTIAVSPDKKPLYHAGLAIAANFLITISQTSLDCLTSAGLEQTDAKAIIQQLQTSVFENMQHSNLPKEALTGPIARGDWHAVKLHLDSLSSSELKEFYLHCLKQTLQTTQWNSAEVLEDLSTALPTE